MIERCFVMVKPELVKESRGRAWGALAYLDNLLMFCTNNLGYRMTALGFVAPREVIEAHYAPHKGKEHYPWLVTQCADQRVIIAVYEGGSGLVGEMRKMAGDKNPRIARMQNYAGNPTVRAKFSPLDESLELSTSERRATRNGIHVSSDVWEAMRELDIWQQFLKGVGPLMNRDWLLSDLCRVAYLQASKSSDPH
jgi:nucleoside diphosphate kinase